MTKDSSVRSGGLSEEHRDLWVKCILAAGFGTEQDRQAFVDGYTLQPLAKLATEGMSRRYEVGRRAHLLLNSKVSAALHKGNPNVQG